MFFLLCEHVVLGASRRTAASRWSTTTHSARRPQRWASRGVGDTGHVGLHADLTDVDLTDVVALLCVRQNPDNLPPHAASTLALYNELNARHPELIPLLKAGAP